MSICKSHLSKQTLIGWAQTDITPERPVFLAGQFYERISNYVHDPITATALAIDNREDQAILVSVDIVDIPLSILSAVRTQLSNEPGIDTSKILLSATHTHTSICVGEGTLISKYESIFGSELISKLEKTKNMMDHDEVFLLLTNKISALIRNAWRSRKPGGISYALDYASIAFNRRPVFDNVETIMYGDCSRDDFQRLEGVSDHTADLLYTWDTASNLTGVAVNIPCPSQVMELHSFISADFWDSARKGIREKHGNIFVLPLCGAAGDQNPLDLIRISKTNAKELIKWGEQIGEVFRNLDMLQECQDIGDRIADAVSRGYKKARNRIQMDVTLIHRVTDITLPLRLVTEDEYREAISEIEGVKKRFSKDNKIQISDMVPLFKSVGVILRKQQQSSATTIKCDVHVIRIGNIVITTNPFELFTEYGMRIKARSAADQTFVVQLTNGSYGYLPTKAALKGGSYSSATASTTCGPDGGDMLVEKTLKIVKELWC